jgi:hypothetical protein
MSTIAYIIFSIIIFYVLIIWFFHKANAHFHKMDEKVGNIESAEPTSVYKDSSIKRDNISEQKNQYEEKEIKEEQEIY